MVTKMKLLPIPLRQLVEMKYCENENKNNSKLSKKSCYNNVKQQKKFKAKDINKSNEIQFVVKKGFLDDNGVLKIDGEWILLKFYVTIIP